ncbi:MAG TPA: hypothetical protein VJ476_06000 [Rhizomicrobium sp.]|nr:hypothetical protein [Rhizomicrobium sp.]
MSRKTRVAGLAVLAMTCSGAARAGQILYLTCDNNMGTHTVDLTNNTVDNLPANINPTAIDWQKSGMTATPAGGDSYPYVLQFHVDRTTGIASMHGSATISGGQTQNFGDASGSCVAGAEPATKF